MEGYACADTCACRGIPGRPVPTVHRLKKKVSDIKKSKEDPRNTTVGWSNDGSDALSVHCCVFVLKEQGSGGDGVGEGHMPHAKCANPGGRQGAATAARCRGCQPQKGEKRINNDAPETICMPPPGTRRENGTRSEKTM